MANSYQLEVVTPERVMLSERVVETIAPGSEGELGILANHAPIMTALKPGEVRVTLVDGRTTSHIVIAGGFLEVAPSPDGGRTTILADSAERSDEIDITRAEADLEAARQMLIDAGVDNPQQEQARQAVALGMTQPVEGPRIQQIAQRQGARKPRGEEIRVDRRVARRIQQAHRDQALGIEIAGAEGAAILAPQVDDGTWCDGLGAFVHADFVGKNPGRPGAGAAAFR